MNKASWIILGILILIVLVILFIVIKNRGKSCSCGCSECSVKGLCKKSKGRQ